MNFEVDQLSSTEWARYSEIAHSVAFNEFKPKEWDRIDFALVVRKGEQLVAYITCKELDAKSLYWQFGGAFPGTKGTSMSFLILLYLVAWAKQRYARVTALVENTNTVMLKMALKAGFRIVGIRNFGGKILLEQLLEFN